MTMATEPTKEQMEQLFNTLKEEPQMGKMFIKGKPMLQHEVDTIRKPKPKPQPKKIKK